MKLNRRKFLKNSAGLLVPAYLSRNSFAQSILTSGSPVFGIGSQGAPSTGSGSGGGGGYTANAVSYNGSSQGLSHTVSGLADGKTGLLSLWFLLNGGNGTVMDILQSANNAHVRLIRNSGGTVELKMYNGAGTIILDIETTATFTSSATWHHFIASWDLSGSGTRHLYIDDTESNTFWTFTNDTINYTDGSWNFPNTNVNACLSEMYFAQTYLDLTSSSNRRKFDDGTGPPAKPVSLSSGDGTPGWQPLIYLKNAAASAGGNTGSGGDFTVNGGPLSDCGTHP